MAIFRKTATSGFEKTASSSFLPQGAVDQGGDNTMTDIGLSKKQRVFAVTEDTAGTLQFPSTSDFIRPAGDAVMNQSPTFNDSEEKQDTLDVLDQFQGAMPAGDFSIPTYLRPATTVGGTPQCDAFWKSLQGALNASTTASVSAPGFSDASTTIVVDTVAGGILPEKGMVTIGSELIYYGGLTRTSKTATTATLTSCSRAQNSTSAAAMATDDSVTLTSRFYKQATTSSPCSVWIETDHLVQGMNGCSINDAVFEVTNDGAVKVTFNGQGMQMVWAGKDALTHDHASGTDTLTISNAKRFAVGAYIYNDTLDDDNSNSGYEITAVDSTSASHSITIGSNTSTAWSSGDIIRGYLPDGATVLGTPVEGGDTLIEVNDVSATILPSDVTIGAPKQYVTDEVGTDYPSDFIEDMRDINGALNLYFRKEDAKYFTDGYAGTNVPILISLDDSDGEHRVDVYMKKCKLTVPTVAFAAPAVQLNMTFKALGTVGEDSCEICFN